MSMPFLMMLAADPAWDLVVETALGLMAVGGLGFLLITRDKK
jgi:preprotein translocase subunit Sss1